MDIQKNTKNMFEENIEELLEHSDKRNPLLDVFQRAQPCKRFIKLVNNKKQKTSIP